VSASRTNLGLALVAALLLILQSAALGTIATNKGLGWDGEDYARMLDVGIERGTPNTRLRPLIVLLGRPVFAATGDPIATFRVMNVVYAALLAWSLASLADAYGASRLSKAYFVVTLGLSISTTGMFAYYPVLIDLGAYAVFSLTLLAMVRERWTTAGILLVLAALSREFVVALLAFAVIREVRTIRPWGRAARLLAGTLIPCVATVVAVRAWSTAVDGNQALTVGALLANVELWADPWYAALFGYFLATVFGGVSAIVLVGWRPVVTLFRAEPEWLAYAATVGAFSAVGNADIWRYLAYLVPVAAVLFVRCADSYKPAWRWGVLTVGAVVTVATQGPFRAMSVDRYFGDWFPYYVLTGKMEVPWAVSQVWTWRLRGLLAAVVLLAIVNLLAWWPREVPRLPSRIGG